jgi:hypothetical protein
MLNDFLLSGEAGFYLPGMRYRRVFTNLFAEYQYFRILHGLRPAPDPL